MLCLFLAYTPTSSLSKQCDRVRVAFGEYTWLLTSIELYSPHLCPNTSKSKKKWLSIQLLMVKPENVIFTKNVFNCVHVSLCIMRVGNTCRCVQWIEAYMPIL